MNIRLELVSDRRAVRAPRRAQTPADDGQQVANAERGGELAFLPLSKSAAATRASATQASATQASVVQASVVQASVVQPSMTQSSATRLGRRLAEDRGAVTAEYAIVIMAAVAFAGLLVAIMRSEEIRTMLVRLVENALGAGG